MDFGISIIHDLEKDEDPCVPTYVVGHYKFKYILLPKYLQQWGLAICSHIINFHPSPTFYIFMAYKHGYIYKRIC